MLLGDAAHAIVPFHGQGMNACFEDCLELDRWLRGSANWRDAFAGFAARRKPNTDAIAAMALENFLEMRDTVRDPKFALRRAVSFELEPFPGRFIPRYSMVMFHHEIPYRVAFERGRVQAGIVEELVAGVRGRGDPAGAHGECARRQARPARMTGARGGAQGSSDTTLLRPPLVPSRATGARGRLRRIEISCVTW